jgi:Na+-transporting NADH:ubiquinone oxidoreductase subunit NqrB
MAVYFAGWVFVFFTDNTRWWPLFNGVLGLLLCFNLYVLAPRPKLSLFHPAESPNRSFRPSWLQSSAFALLAFGLAFSYHVRVSALLMMSGLCLAAFDQYRKTNPNRVAPN